MKMRPIDVLNNLKGHMLWPQSYHLSEDEARTCIEALEQQKTGKWIPVNSVKALPSVTPQPKTGYWIGHREHCESLGVIPSGLGAYEWCSNCDCGIDVREWHRNNYNFCPNCGAKMVEPQEREEV